MSARLSAREVSLLALDLPNAPAHLGTVEIFDAGPAGGFDYDALVRLVEDRLSYVPRYRMRVMNVPGALAAPVWVEDEEFDLSYHLTRSALPSPGTMGQLREYVGRVMGRRLDRSRPLWEMHLVEGLEENRFALVTKSHEVLVDGVDNVDIGQVLLDETPEPEFEPLTQEPWEPAPEPRPFDLLLNALTESLQDVDSLTDTARRGLAGVLGTAAAVGEVVGGVSGVVGELAGAALRGGRLRGGSPLAGIPSEQRRVAQFEMSLADLRELRMQERYTVNDVVLALIAGGMRDWLATRGESMPRGEVLAMVPMSVTDDDGEPTSLGSHVAPHLIQLPIGEANALMRLHQVSFGTRAHTDTGRAVGARVISDIAGFAPTTLHSLGVRVGQSVNLKPHDMLITNAPGPQHALYAAGARMVASYPVLPLVPGQLLAIGITSYNGKVFFGLTGDRDRMSDLDVLAQCIVDARVELLETAAQAEANRQPTRKAGVKRGGSERPEAAKEPDEMFSPDETELLLVDESVPDPLVSATVVSAPLLSEWEVAAPPEDEPGVPAPAGRGGDGEAATHEATTHKVATTRATTNRAGVDKKRVAKRSATRTPGGRKPAAKRPTPKRSAARQLAAQQQAARQRAARPKGARPHPAGNPPSKELGA